SAKLVLNKSNIGLRLFQKLRGFFLQGLLDDRRDDQGKRRRRKRDQEQSEAQRAYADGREDENDGDVEEIPFVEQHARIQHIDILRIVGQVDVLFERGQI